MAQAIVAPRHEDATGLHQLNGGAIAMNRVRTIRRYVGIVGLCWVLAGCSIQIPAAKGLSGNHIQSVYHSNI